MARDHWASPPRWATLLMEARLPSELAEAMAGDLEEEYRNRVLPARGKARADLWYWGQALGLRAGALRRISGRLGAMRPTFERNRPRRVGSRQTDFWSRMPMRLDDLKYAARRLIKSPGFTLVAVLSLALGIGANTAMFSIVNAVLLRRLPLAHPEQLVEVYTSEDNGYPASTSSYPDFADLRDHNDIFSGVVGERTEIARVDRDGEPSVVFGELVSWDFFRVLGVPMALGRSFLPEEGATPMTHPVVVLGYRMWVKEYGQDPGIVGKTVRLSGRAFTVVGVAPKAFTGTFPVLVTSFYAPMMMSAAFMDSEGQELEQRNSRSMFLKARLKPGVTVAQANAALKAFSAGLAERYPDSNKKRIMSAVSTEDVSIHPLVDKAALPVAGLLLTVVGLVLLIACVNLASFLLARAEDRRREIAVRLALGAGRGALVRQLLVETVVLSLLGGLAGIGLARWTLDLLMGFKPPIPVPIELDVSVDGHVLLFTLGVSLLAGLLFGLVPALQATNPDVAPTLKDEAGRAGKPGRFNLRSTLVVTQVAFSFVLLIGAGLFVRSLQKAQTIDPGFYTGPAAMVMPMMELSDYKTDDQIREYYRTLKERLLADPDIDQVAIADRLPLGMSIRLSSFILPEVPSDRPDGDWEIDAVNVTPGYFETMEVPVVEGHAFTEADVYGEAKIMVSQAFVQRFYPGQDVVGRTIQDGDGRPLRIVGVARDTKVRTLGEAPRPYVYRLQGRTSIAGMMEFIVRGRASAPKLLADARRVVNEVDPDVPLFDAKTMNEHLSLMLFAPRMAALLLSVFGALALALAGVGIYGVVSYAVSRRTRELGIRMSLGASASDVVTMAVKGGMRLVVIGGLIGVVLAGGVTWSISRWLYGIGSTDVATFVAIPLLLSGVALLAAFVPARRASKVDPVRALRSE
ncbi:MAG: ABC transporter permease [Gemmatimonadetes bacterium]|nr:ABC transporter permease [Gemmatimonadota bacterium]